jgi:hypothetical protein
MNTRHPDKSVSAHQQEDDLRIRRTENRNEEASRVIGGGQHQSMLGQGLLERLTSHESTLNGSPQRQQHFHFNQKHDLPQHSLALQLSLIGQTSHYYGQAQSQEAAPFQHAHALANHANNTQPLLNSLPLYLDLQQLSSAFGLPAPRNPAAKLQFQGLSQAQEEDPPVTAPMQPLGNNESTLSLRPSTVTDYIPQMEERTIASSKGSSIIPCRARRMPMDHNSQVNDHAHFRPTLFLFQILPNGFSTYVSKLITILSHQDGILYSA